MWNYEKRLQYPVKITQTNPKIAQIIISQFGGPDGELAASMRYLSQRYTMPYKEVTGTLTDIGTEELAHMEMICAIVYQLTKDLTPEEIVAKIYPTKENIEKYNDIELEKIVRQEVKRLSLELSPYKRPNSIVITKEPLPRTGISKVSRKKAVQSA